MKNDMKILEKVSIFNDFTDNEIETIIECLNGKIRSYGKHESIVLAGDKVSSLGIVLSGNVQISREDIMGNRMIVAGLLEGEIFGETFASAGLEVSPVSIYALMPSKILWLSINRIVSPCASVCGFHSKLIRNLLQLIATKNMFLNERMNLLSKRTIREKIMSYLVSQAGEQSSSEFEIPLNRNELADYLCIDRSAMSRELGKLRDEGMIEFHKNTFHLICKCIYEQ